MNDTREWLLSREATKSYLVDNFSNLLKEGVTQCQQLDDFIQATVSRDENDAIVVIPFEMEILEVIQMMNPIKAPGPNGMLAIFFFQQY